jgi:uncharacterized protein (TIGR02271 family)
MNQIITAAFDSRSDATEAVARLVKAGISRSNIRIIPETDATGTAGGSPSFAGQTGVRPSSEYTHYDVKQDEKGFWASLGDLFMPDDDRSTYTEALHRGSIMVSATVDASQAAIAEDILDDEGTINLDERSQSWRSEGWQGYYNQTGGSAGGASQDTSTGFGLAGAAAASALGQSHATSGAATSSPRTGAAPSGGTASSAGRSETDNGAIPIVQEQLHVGKRVENAGRVRVRSYVVETPVQEKVNLREESVQIERRPVNREASATDGNLFQDRTIEATEQSERAVVSKEARVTEELVVKKDVEERTETISDKVRHTEVEVDDERTKGGVGSTASTTTPGTTPKR